MLDRLSATSWWSKPASEISRIGDRDGSILLLPVGSIEQHGHHLPVATDTVLVESITRTAADAVAEAVPVLVAPPVWSGYSPHHLAFGGTFTLEFDTLMSVLEELADAALDNGFDALVFINGHGGNVPLIGGVTSTVGTTHPEAEILGLTYFTLAEPFVDDLRDSELGGMAHGGEFETSLMLHFCPELVRTDRLEGEMLDEPYEQGLKDLFASGPLGVYRPFEAYSESGAIGSPEQASAEKGQELAEGITTSLATLLREIHDRNQSS